MDSRSVFLKQRRYSDGKTLDKDDRINSSRPYWGCGVGGSNSLVPTNFPPFLKMLDSYITAVSAIRLAASRTAIGSGFLNGRTRNGSERTENAAISFVRTQNNSASLAVIKKLASIGWHSFGFGMATFWACYH